MFQPHTIDSLLAKNFLYFTNLIVGFNPVIPGIALIVKSLLILRLLDQIDLNFTIFIVFLFNF